MTKFSQLGEASYEDLVSKDIEVEDGFPGIVMGGGKKSKRGKKKSKFKKAGDKENKKY